MKILIGTDVSVLVNGCKIYAKNKYATIFNRYYTAFGTIVLFSRVEYSTQPEKDCVEITNIIDSIIPITSLKDILLNKYNKTIMAHMQSCDLVIARCPSMSGYKVADCARKLNKPVFTESMGCAWDAYWNHGIVGKIIAPYMFLKMRTVVKKADYALYVTRDFLQKRYPCKCESLSASNVLIENVDTSILAKRLKKKVGSELALMTTAAVNVKYKGQQYVIRAIPRLNALGIRVKYILVGEGDVAYLRHEAETYGVADQVEFKGRLPLSRIFDLLDKTDIYIQPSLQEGLPRAMIEAMSRGCVCIGAKTAGIPELIEEKFVVRRKSVSDIVRTVSDYMNESLDMHQLTFVRNFEEARKYESSILDERRNSYYEKVKKEIYHEN